MPWEDGTLKYDLHKHFGGSISPATVAELLPLVNGKSPSVADVERRMVCRRPVRDFGEFLDKFDILNEIHWTEKAIAKSIDQVVSDQAKDGVDYAEISFSFDKYMDNHVKWTRPELIRFVRDVFADTCSLHQTSVGLVMSLRMEADRDKQRVNAAMIKRTDVVDALVGIDVVGDESKFAAGFYEPIFRDWRSAGKVTMAHVGETGSFHNVMEAITRLHVDRVRHGIAAAAHPETLAAARDLGVCFDVSLHSNLLANTVPGLINHHLPRLLEAGCFVTLGTDDPAVFNCRLVDEYTLGLSRGLIKSDDVVGLRRNSVQFSARHVRKVRG